MNNTDERSVQMLCAALEMEEKGKAFYEKALAISRNPLGREIFKTLIADEIVHRERIQKIYDSLMKDQGWNQDWEHLVCPVQDWGTVFRDLAAQYAQSGATEAGDLETVEIARDFELRSIAFYENHLAQATEPLEQAFLNQMIREEKSHYRALQDTYYYLTDPEGWFIEKEKAGLEGAG
ncbi:MAG: ferritin family protein [Deltaproteobacteria bacterium]|nr:ferritin family protein [Deltaproteobacteria bacterium]